MHNHIHNCTHENLKHCSICDTVYCTNCGKEWKVTYTWYPYSTVTYTYPPTTSVYNGNDSQSTPTTSPCHSTAG